MARWTWTVVAVGLAGVSAACGGDDDTGSGAGTTTDTGSGGATTTTTTTSGTGAGATGGGGSGAAGGSAGGGGSATPCGDGHIDAGETCDDGGTAADDGCGASCQTETGWSCAGEPSVCTPICGDGMIIAPETCDDGNAVGNDGCDAACHFECKNESEPNETSATASGPVTPGTFLACGSIASAIDTDVYAVTVGAEADLKIETFDENGPPSCMSPHDTKLVLRAADGSTILASDDDGGPGFCSLVDPAVAAGAQNLAPGTYFVVVTTANNAIPGYSVRLTYTSLCGNGVVEPHEACDDGNTQGGDACPASCN